MADKRVNIRVKMTGAEKAEKGFKKLGAGIAAMALQFGAATLAIGTVTKALKDAINAAADQEQIFRKMRTSLELTGVSYKKVSKDLLGYFELLQRTTEYGDTDSAQVFTTLLQLTGDYDKSLQALPIALNLAASGLFDMNTAARNVGLALSGNIEILARYFNELKAGNTPFLATASAAEKTAFAIDFLNETFNKTAQENVKTYVGQMKQLVGRLVDVQEKTGSLFINFAVWTGALGATEAVLREVGKSWLNLSPVVLAWNLLIGESTEKLKDLAAAVRPMVEEEFFDPEPFTEYVNVWATWATEIAKVGKVANLAGNEFKGIQKHIESLNESTGVIFESTAEQLSKVSEKLLGTFDYVFTETLIREKNFGDAMVAGFKGMLARMVAELAARAAVFGVLNFITGGSFGIDVGGFGSFVGKSLGITGVSPTVAGNGGGSSVNINMPNVTMINSRSISQLNQALTLHNRRH